MPSIAKAVSAWKLFLAFAMLYLMIWPNMTTAIISSSIVGLLSAHLARRRGRNPFGWFAIGFFFGLFGVLAIFFIPQSKKEEIGLAPLQPAPKPYLFGPINKFWYYLDKTHSQVGPMSYNAISKTWQEGKLPPATLVWNEDLEGWKPLQDLIRMQN